ncbi:MAG TPA: hypothetical protein VI542_36855, partial [Candidatus Tectomicrobia bacterium]
MIDLGLRLDDVTHLGLDSEPCDFGKDKKDPREKLREYGATDDECQFLVSGKQGGRWIGRR